MVEKAPDEEESQSPNESTDGSFFKCAAGPARLPVKKRLRTKKNITIEDRKEKVRKNRQTLAELELEEPKDVKARKHWQRTISGYISRIFNYD